MTAGFKKTILNFVYPFVKRPPLILEFPETRDPCYLRIRAVSLACKDASYPYSTVKLVLSNRVWALKKWPLNTGGLCIEVKINSKGAFGTQPSGL